MLVVKMMDMENDYERIRELMDKCQDDVFFFLHEIDKIECPRTKKIQTILKIASVQIKENPKMQKFMEKALDMLRESENDMQISDNFLCALGYEKIKKYDIALQYYEKCMGQLPDSSMKSALLGMKYRVLSKKEKGGVYFDLAVKAFSKAALEEEIDWKKKKWEAAVQEMTKQKILKWE